MKRLYISILALLLAGLVPAALPAHAATASASVSVQSAPCATPGGLAFWGTGSTQTAAIVQSDFNLTQVNGDGSLTSLDRTYIAYPQPQKAVSEYWYPADSLTSGQAYKIWFHLWDKRGNLLAYDGVPFSCS